MTTYAAVTTLLPHVTPYLRDCPDPIATQTLRAAARQFCIDTEPWLAWLTTIPSVAAQADYTLAAPAGADAIIRRVKRVRIDDNNQPPSGYFFNDPDAATLRFHKGFIPQSTGTDIDVRVSLIPKISCVNYPDWLLDKWGFTIVDGTLKSLLAMRNKPWFDPDGARTRGASYYASCSDAKRELMDHSKDADLQPRPVRFGYV